MCNLDISIAFIIIINNNNFLSSIFIVTTTWDVQGPVGVNVPGTDGAPGWSALHEQPVIRPAEQLLVPQRELISREQMSAAHRAPETLHVIHVIPGPHHQVTAAKTDVAFGAFDPE